MNEDQIIEQAIQGHVSTRDAIRWAIQQEREACARLFDEVPDDDVYCGSQYAAAIRARGEKPLVKSYAGGKPNYCTPVDAVNMTLDRVYETAKGEHEPVAWAYPEFFNGLKNHRCWTVYEKEGKGPHLDGIERTPLYTAPPSIEAAVLAEREACANLCEKMEVLYEGDEMLGVYCADAIRARSEK